LPDSMPDGLAAALKSVIMTDVLFIYDKTATLTGVIYGLE